MLLKLPCICCLFLMASVLSAQTIDIKDFDYFVGCFAVKDTLDRESIDCSQFIDWRVIKPGENSPKRDYSEISYSKNRHWVYDWDPITDQDGKVTMSINNYLIDNLYFYILMDYFGHESRINVLTVWERVGRDSLRYYCGLAGNFDTGLGRAGVKHVNIFPDSSLLLVINKEGEMGGSYIFYHGTSPCKFEVFYSTKWRYPHLGNPGKYTEAFYDFRHVGYPNYQVIETNEHISIELLLSEDHYNTLSESIDSVTVKTINLWDIVKK